MENRPTSSQFFSEDPVTEFAERLKGRDCFQVWPNDISKSSDFDGAG